MKISLQMNIEDLYNYCVSLKGVEATTPFDDVTLVMKVCGKMFALIPLDTETLSITLKCDAEEAIALREKYNCVHPGHHMNKNYWNTIYITGEMPDAELKRWIDHSAEEVIKKLPKIKQKEYYGTTE